MAPFLLHAYIPPRIEKKWYFPNVEKNRYNVNVKIDQWQEFKNAYPFDYDPYNPACYNLHRSHYKNFGISETPYLTESKASFRGSQPKIQKNPDKKLINLYTMENFGEPPEDVDEYFCAADYLSQYQTDYRVPKPYAMKRLSAKKTPYWEHRRFVDYCPKFYATKFMDDNFQCNGNRLRSYKKGKSISFNPFKSEYTSY